MGRTINGFIWFLHQATIVGGLGVHWFVLGTVILAIVAAWKFPKGGPSRARLPLLLLLPVFWMVMGLWGSFFWYDWQAHAPKNPEWVMWPDMILPVLFFLTLLSLMVYMRGARIVTLTVGVWNTYFVAAMYLMSSMAITGEWL